MEVKGRPKPRQRPRLKQKLRRRRLRRRRKPKRKLGAEAERNAKRPFKARVDVPRARRNFRGVQFQAEQDA